MGRSKKIKAARRKAREQTAREREAAQQTRSRFPTRAVALGGTLLTLVVGGFLALRTQDSQPPPQELPPQVVQKDYTWSFLREPELFTTVEMLRRGVAVGPESDLMPGVTQFHDAYEWAHPLMSKVLEVQVGEQYGISLFESTHVVPGKPEAMEAYAAYVKKAAEYLRERVPALDFPTPEVVVVNPGDDFSVTKGYEHRVDEKIFLCERYYTTQKVTGAKGATVAPPARRHLAYPGSLLRTIEGITGRSHRFMILGQGPTALRAYFSEVIPYHTKPVDEQYWARVGNLEGTTATETFSEGMAAVLAEELGKRLNLPDSVSTAFTFRPLPKYKFVPKGTAVVRRMGPAAAYDLYMGNPGAFMDIVRAEP